MNIVFAEWNFEPVVIGGIVLFGFLYFLGRCNLSKSNRDKFCLPKPKPFLLGLLTIIIALESPIDFWSLRLFWIHILQHELLMMVAAPLIVAGGPFIIIEGLPGSFKKALRQRISKGHFLGKLFSLVTNVFYNPYIAGTFFIVDFAIWHLPYAYDLTLKNSSIHDFEHLIFLLSGMWFWFQAMNSYLITPRLSPRARISYLGFTALALSVGDLVFIIGNKPIYAYYQALDKATHLTNPLADQVLAGGVMDAIGIISLVSVAFRIWNKLDPSS